MEVTREVLTIDVIVGRIDERQSFITRIGILSIPGDLLEDIDVIILSICLLSVGQKVNCSDNKYCLGIKHSLRAKLFSLANELILLIRKRKPMAWPWVTKWVPTMLTFSWVT